MGYHILSKTLLIVGLVLSGSAMAAGASPSMLGNTCAGCHGPEGNSQGPATPGIAGLSKGYLVAAMLAYKYGEDEEAIEKVVSKMPMESDEFEVLPRNSTIMGRIAKGYTDDEILKLAEFFSKQTFVRNKQDTDKALVKKGQRLHDKNCEKCHEDGGRTSVDDVGLMAGQWMPYLSNTLSDFKDKHRKMPKKMAKKMKRLKDDDLEALVHYYGSQK